MFKDLKIQLPIHKDQYKIIFIHLGIILMSLIVGAGYNTSTYGQNSSLITGIVVTICFIVILSLADCLNIIEFRKSAHRLTKCALCGRVSEKERHDEEGKIVKTVEVEKDDDSSVTRQFAHETKKAVPLHGIVIEGKLVCSHCLTELSKIKWEK